MSRERQEAGETCCLECGEPEAAPITLRGMTSLLCADCVRKNIIWTQSLLHLKELIGEAYHDWLTIWANDPEYTSNWEELYAQMTTNLELKYFVMDILTQRGIVPATRKGRGHA